MTKRCSTAPFPVVHVVGVEQPGRACGRAGASPSRRRDEGTRRRRGRRSRRARRRSRRAARCWSGPGGGRRPGRARGRAAPGRRTTDVRETASRAPVTGRRGRRRAAGSDARPVPGADDRGGRRRGGRSRRRSTEPAPASRATREKWPSLAPRSSTMFGWPTAATRRADERRLGLEVAVACSGHARRTRPGRIVLLPRQPVDGLLEVARVGRRSAPARSRPASARRGRRARDRRRRTCVRRGRAAGRG